MSHFDFVIPSKQEDLLSSVSGVYCVKDFGKPSTLLDRLKDAKIGFEADGPEFIFEHFDTFFSVLCHADKMEINITDKGWILILRAFNTMSQNLKAYLDENSDIDEEVRIKYCNLLKMTVYIYTEFMHFYERKQNAHNENIFDKKRRLNKKADSESDWYNEKHNALVKIYNLIKAPLCKLWDPPLVEETFINLIADYCYECLKDPRIKSIKHLCDTIFEILGTLIKTYNYGFLCAVKLINIVKTYEHVSTVASQGVALLVNEYGCKSLIGRLVHEIVEWQGSEANTQNAAETRQCSTFLIELATVLPQEMIPQVTYLGDQLENDSYAFRNSVLSIMTEVLLTVLSAEGLSEEAKIQRDCFLDHLEEHLCDVSALVRSKVLQLWTRLQRNNSIPLNRQLSILSKAIERLGDKASNVRKFAISTVIAFLECNPFGSILDADKYANDLKRDSEKLDTIKKKYNISDINDKNKEWAELWPSLKEFIENKLKIEDPEQDIVATPSCLSDVINDLKSSLINKDFEKTFKLLRATENATKQSEERRKLEFRAQVDYFMMMLNAIFFNSVNDDASVNNITEILEEINMLEKVIEFQTECLNFLSCISLAIDKIKLLVKSKTVESTEAMEFFTIASKFHIKGSLSGVLEMLNLMYCVEQDKKDAASKALNAIWFSVDTNSQRVRAVEIVKTLILVIQNIKSGHHEAFKQLIFNWVKNNEISSQEVNALWEFFSMKLEGISENDSRAALHLLSLIGVAKPEIIKANVNVLITIGLGPRGMKDFRIIEDTCVALCCLSKIQKGTVDKAPFRYKSNTNLVERLVAILKDGWEFQDKYYIRMAFKIIDVFYEICDKPDEICGTLYHYFHKLLSGSIEESTISINWLIQFISFIGHVALRQLIYMDIIIYKELKRRNEYRTILEQKKNKRKTGRSRDTNTSFNVSDAKSTSSSASLCKNKSVLNDDENAVEGAVAEDADAEYILNIFENTLLGKKSLLGNALNMIITIVENPSKYPDSNLQTACVLALTKMMCISAQCTEAHCQLLFTLLEKSHNETIRSNVIIALTDLTKRFPNVLDPWTAYMYKRIHDSSDEVRQTTVIMLSYLIMHELIRVKRYISDLALCLVDKNDHIRNLTEVFFKQLGLKGNALYNVMPDIISRLSDPEINITQDKFKTIMKFIMGLIQKDKQIQSLVEKICLRFQLSTTAESQWSQLAYCLTLINYNEKGLRKLIDSIPTLKDKLQNDDVYNSFKTIISTSLKSVKPEIKVVAMELSEKIEECFKGLVGDDVDQADKTIEKTVRKLSTRKKTQKKKVIQNNSSSSENSSESSDDNFEEEKSNRSTRRSNNNSDEVFKKPLSVRKKRRN